MKKDRKIFVNLPVRDLKKTVDFFTKLGFTFDPRFTDENATCMIIGKDSSVMLLVDKFFSGFIPGKKIADAKSAEVLVSLSTERREEVDEILAKAVAAGGSEYSKPQDYGWMYMRDFQDINGHIWEIGYMDMENLPEEMKAKGRK